MTDLICGCGHPMSDHSRDETGACMVAVSDEYWCSCITATADPNRTEEAVDD